MSMHSVAGARAVRTWQWSRRCPAHSVGIVTHPPHDFADLSALFINTTLTRSPAMSHTQLLIDVSASIMAKQGVRVDQFRAVDHPIATGVYPDMHEHGWSSDEW